MSEFKQKVINAIKLVPYGHVASYGQIALMVGFPRGARAVGQTLRSTEDDVTHGNDTLPWHRIVNNAGRISIKGCKYHTPIMQKEKLEEEGIVVSDELTFDIEKSRFRPHPDELKDLQLSDEHIAILVEKYLL